MGKQIKNNFVSKAFIKTRIVLILVIAFSNCYSQERIEKRGTIIMAVVVNDSILMFSDSRVVIGVVGDDADCSHSYAYVDSLAKIFRLGDFLIAYSGIGDFDNKPIYEVFSDFKKVHPEKQDFQTTITALQKYMDEKYPVSKFPSNKNIFIAGGFNQNKAFIIEFNRTTKKVTPESFKTGIGLVSNDSTIFKYLTKVKPSPFTCSTMSYILTNDIERLSYETHNLCIGGPVEVALLTKPNKITWTKNNFSNHIYSNKQMVTLIKNNKMTLTALIYQGREKALKLLQDNE